MKFTDEDFNIIKNIAPETAGGIGVINVLCDCGNMATVDTIVEKSGEPRYRIQAIINALCKLGYAKTELVENNGIIKRKVYLLKSYK